MANGNDPANIAYIIAENGFYYVAYKEKVKVPEVVVSAKGVANGLSEEYNDGWDFGPDSYDPTSTANPPYTQTAGIQEAQDYVSDNSAILLETGIYNPQITIKIEKNIVFLGTPSIQINFGPMGSQYGLSPVAIQSGGNFPTFEIEEISSITAPSISFIGITLIGSNDTSYTDEVAILGDPSASEVNIDFSFSRITAYYDCVHLEGHYSIFSANSSLFDSFLNGGIKCDYGELNLIFCHINNAALTSALSTGYAIEINTTFQKAAITQCILEARGTVINFNGITGNCQIVGGHLYNNVAGYALSISGNAGELLRIIGCSGYSGNGSAFMYIDTAVKNLNVSSVNAQGTSDLYSLGSSGSISSNVNIENSYPLPAPTLTANPPVSAKVYQNTNPYDIEIDLPVYATTSGTAGYVTVAKGSTSTPTAIANQYVSGDTSSTSEQIIRLRVPAGWYYEFTASGVTFGTASVFAD